MRITNHQNWGSGLGLFGAGLGQHPTSLVILNFDYEGDLAIYFQIAIRTMKILFRASTLDRSRMKGEVGLEEEGRGASPPTTIICVCNYGY